MSQLLELRIHNFRNLLDLKCDNLSPGFNIIHGENGSGKTSFLEAIYFLSLGRSFRANRSSQDCLINDEAPTFTLYTKVLSKRNQETNIGIERDRSGLARIRINGNDESRLVKLVGLMPVKLINHDAYNLLVAGPSCRRRFIDWGCFHADQGFIQDWKGYAQVLKQRNAALKNNAQNLHLWDQQLIEYAAKIDSARKLYLKAYEEVFQSILDSLLPGFPVVLKYHQGWSEKLDYETALKNQASRDKLYGVTHAGPHRGDIDVLMNNVPAKDFLSRGQQKLLICGMLLSQGVYLDQNKNKKTVYLIDDLPAELDEGACYKLLNLLSGMSAQTFVTAIECGRLSSMTHNEDACFKFHVKHGEFVEDKH